MPKKDYLKIFLQRMRMIYYVIAYPLFQLFVKERDNNILFLSDSRTTFSGNFAFVKDELERRGGYEIRGIFKKSLRTPRPLKDYVRLVYFLARSKYVFVDDFYPLIYPIRLKKSKELIQLWHAMGAYKTVGYARTNNGYTLTHRNYTKAIVSSEKIRKDYAKAFGISIDKVYALGIPRTDIFFDAAYAKRVKEMWFKKYPVLKDKKILLFAPTFRGAGQKSAYYDFSKIDFTKIKEVLQDEYICIIKLHPFIQNRPDIDFENDPFYLDLTSEREINDLLFITDLLITDYSSVIFEYSLFNKPLIYYVPDLEEYIGSRDFFYPFDHYDYGLVAHNMDELVAALKNPQVDLKKLKDFKDYFCSQCDGEATKRVVDTFIGG